MLQKPRKEIQVPPFFDRLDKLDDVVQQRILDDRRGKVTKK